MVMTCALLVYSVAQRWLRRQWAHHNETVPNQIHHPTTSPTLRWIFQLLEGMLAQGIPMSAINTMEQVVKHPSMPARGMIIESEHPVAGKVKSVGVPVKLSETPGSVREPAPLLGQHTDEVLHEYLVMTNTEISALRQEGVIGTKRWRIEIYELVIDMKLLERRLTLYEEKYGILSEDFYAALMSGQLARYDEYDETRADFSRWQGIYETWLRRKAAYAEQMQQRGLAEALRVQPAYER
jgi:CoA transferase family III